MPSSQLADNIGYQLQLAALTSNHEARQELAGLQLTPARVTALVHIRDQPGCDQTELGQRLLVNRAAGMKIANALAEQGLIKRIEGRDRRSRGLTLTPYGKQMLADATRRLARAGDLTCRGLDENERERLLHLLRKLNAANVSAVDPSAPPHGLPNVL
ncbi:MarR family winged helix-turn-helix transcriptional regulator [Brenneria populi subsp. brevivirga]|uniref:MarR family winged helix-turn-helix transcriptional regulator n=1 Tax=Brenneria populi TaxID=1505588 RepID=UPI002E19ED70|nr:MarR family winged helix-turn-helix transcriptional regulator [Brenneria populi subsp. brevivirga]